MRPTIEQLSAENWKAVEAAEKNRQAFDELYQLTMQLAYKVQDIKSSSAWPQYRKKVLSLIATVAHEAESSKFKLGNGKPDKDD